MKASLARATRTDPDDIPAWLDLIEGVTGLALVLFMWGHMFLVASILLGNDAMYLVARWFEGEPLLGRPYPVLISAIAAFVFALIVIHAVAAIHKIPFSYDQYSRWRKHAAVFRHADTGSWMLQVVTGFVLMFLVVAHLFQMMFHPGDIGPYASADRVWSGRWWPFYLVLLFAVELHGGIGIYRLAVKWGWFANRHGHMRRVVLRRIKWGLTTFFIVLGLLTLGAYMKLGYAHRDRVGERYFPAVDTALPAPALPGN